MPIIALTPRNGRRTTPPSHNDPATWLRRSEVAKILNMTNVGVLHAERAGGLHPISDDRGDKLYDPAEVQAYAVSHPRRGARFYDDGDLAAEAAKLFAAGVGRREIVMRLRVTFDRVDDLYLEWSKGDDLAAAAARRKQERTEAALAREERRRARERTTRLNRASRLLAAAAAPSTPRGTR